MCGNLAFWTEANPDKMDELFRQSGLFRPKWDQRHGSNTYGQMTIEKALAGGVVDNRPSFETDANNETEVPRFNLTDIGNSERLIHHHGEDIRYCHAWSRWLIWDGSRWAPDNADRIKQLAKKVVRSIYAEAEQITDGSERRDIARHAMRSESNRSINAMVSLAESEVPIRPEDLDQDPYLLNCNNGTLNLNTGKLREHRRQNFITKLVPVAYHPEAEHHQWSGFLNRILDGNQELVGFMQRAIGYSLTGRTDEQCLLILYGSGANGKTTFLQAISEVLSEYAMQTPTETLLVKGKGAIPNDVARLKGARFVTASEAWEEWCNQNGEHPTTRRLFTRRLNEMGFENERIGSERARGLKGLALNFP